MTVLIIFIAIFLFVLYLFIDLFRSNVNAFFEKWAKKTVFFWLPFYALKRLIKEIFFDKK